MPKNVNYGRRAAFQFLALTIFCLAARVAVACVCPNTDDTVLGKFEDAGFVVIVKVISVEKMPRFETIYHGNKETKSLNMIVKSTKMVIEKVYKGNLKVGDEMIFGQGDSARCLEEFDDDHVGVKSRFESIR